MQFLGAMLVVIVCSFVMPHAKIRSGSSVELSSAPRVVVRPETTLRNDCRACCHNLYMVPELGALLSPERQQNGTIRSILHGLVRMTELGHG